MTTVSGLHLFLGASTLLDTVSGVYDGRLYGGYGGEYVYKTPITYRVEGVLVPIFNGFSSSIANIATLNGLTKLSFNRGLVYDVYSQKYGNESLLGWTRDIASIPGFSNESVSDDGTGFAIPLLIGEYHLIGNRINSIIGVTYTDSDTGIPQTTEIAKITDLEATI